MSPIHFGTDGWRARFDDSFNEVNVSRVADAAAKLFIKEGEKEGFTIDSKDETLIPRVIVGYDTRHDAREYGELVAGVLAAHGIEAVLSSSYCPTPTLCWSVARDARAIGGIMLTASHNPGEYLGIKIRMADGGASPKYFTDQLEQALVPVPFEGRGEFLVEDLMTPYLENLRASVDVEAISAAHLKVVHDPLYGASRTYMSALLRDVGVEVIEIHGDAVDDFGGLHPEPIEPWVEDCQRAVVEHHAAAGLINDGDADRIGAVDENGNFVNPHKIIALVMGHLVENKGMSGRVVTTLSSSALVKRQAARLNCPLTITPIGFKWIYAEMLKGDVLIGGEESGGIGLPGHVLERDGLLMDLLLCELLATTGMSLGEAVADLEAKVGHCDYHRRDLRLDPISIDIFRNTVSGMNPELVAGRKPIFVNHADGLRVEFDDDSWLLLRPSGTEPLVRVYAEAATEELRDELLDAGCALAQGE